MSTRIDSTQLQYASLLASNTNPKPTIVDVIAQENMQSLFRTAFTHLLKWLSLTFRRLRKLDKHRDTLYLAILSLIEISYLTAYDGLFSEHFYGLKRSGIGGSKWKRLFGVLLGVVLPFLKAKLDQFYEEIERMEELPTRVEKFLLKVHPYVNFVWHGCIWYFRFVFMIGKSVFNSPMLWVLNTPLVYATDVGKLNVL